MTLSSSSASADSWEESYLPCKRGNVRQDVFWQFLPDPSHTQTRFPHLLLLWRVRSLDEQCAGTRSRRRSAWRQRFRRLSSSAVTLREYLRVERSGVHEGVGGCAAVFGISPGFGSSGLLEPGTLTVLQVMGQPRTANTCSAQSDPVEGPEPLV